MGWRIAKAVEKLFVQLNTSFPDRSRVSDGAKGDAAHAARTSDHNPWVRDDKGVGVVTARDFTHDHEHMDAGKLLGALLKSRDKRIKYIIYDRRIYNCKDGFKARPYNGANAHRHHLHLSVKSDPAFYDDISAWDLSGYGDAEATGIRAVPEVIDIRKGATGEHVRQLQRALAAKGLLKESDIDGDFGAKTEKAVMSLQLDKKLRVDGIVGPQTAALLALL